ncbi:hypothetical protein ACN28S_56895 [Cystobacter fuscus]
MKTNDANTTEKHAKVLWAIEIAVALIELLQRLADLYSSISALP